jgi:hypothetical protein
MPRAINLELEQRWRERFQEFKSSGLSVRQYCRSHLAQNGIASLSVRVQRETEFR